MSLVIINISNLGTCKTYYRVQYDIDLNIASRYSAISQNDNFAISCRRVILIRKYFSFVAGEYLYDLYRRLYGEFARYHHYTYIGKCQRYRSRTKIRSFLFTSLYVQTRANVSKSNATGKHKFQKLSLHSTMTATLAVRIRPRIRIRAVTSVYTKLLNGKDKIAYIWRWRIKYARNGDENIGAGATAATQCMHYSARSTLTHARCILAFLHPPPGYTATRWSHALPRIACPCVVPRNTHTRRILGVYEPAICTS